MQTWTAAGAINRLREDLRRELGAIRIRLDSIEQTDTGDHRGNG